MNTFTPEVNVASEFLEICSDFGDPKEIIREAISNSFDANAREIRISVVVDKSSGDDELVITIADDGEGMDESDLRKFFGLGFTNRLKKDKLGRKISEAIGEKGHGTKIYFNSRQVELATTKGGKTIRAQLTQPKKILRQSQLPKVEYEITSNHSKPGTTITIRGYNDNLREGFSHEELKDYIYWFTKFGSFEKEIDKDCHRMSRFEDVVILLSGLGWEDAPEDKLSFGHIFPEVDKDMRKLREKDPVSPLDYYVARWLFSNVNVIGMPGTHLDFVFYIEGDRAKRRYNKMIHSKGPYKYPGQYRVDDRYGLWLCKDYIPIERRNAWVAEKGYEWTKFHALVNCQELRLTANRGDVGNTPPETLRAIESTVRKLFEETIKRDEDFTKYEDELKEEDKYQSAQREEKEFEKRRKASLRTKVATHKDTELFEPRMESGVFSLALQLLTIEPAIFGFKIVDYDTSIGYDLLVTKDYALDLNKAQLMFTEMKYELQREFDHSFKRLSAVICWDTKLPNGDKVADPTGEERTMRITPRDKKVEKSYTKYMLVSDTEPHNIEVFVLKDFLRERLGLDFRPRATK